MNDEDSARCQQAIDLANAGQTRAAYTQFCALYHLDNLKDVTLLYWLAYTTPSIEEAQQDVETIARLEPNHPKLQELQAYVNRKRQRLLSSGESTPTLQCPYCRYMGPVRVLRKVSIVGCVWFFFFILLCLFCWFAPVPTTQTASMGSAGFFFLLIGALGLLFRKRLYVCSSCRITLGDVASY